VNSAEPLLAALQHGDSFFPSGAASFSWGLETLTSEGAVSSAQDVQLFVLSQLRGRWVSFDRGVVSAAFEKSGNIDEILKIDALVEMQTLASKMREGSHRSGQALLQVHEKLGNKSAAAYREYVLAAEAPGNLNVMQGFLWAKTGMTAADVVAVSAHSLCVGFLGAAVRLGVIGHVETQRILKIVNPVISDLCKRPMPICTNLRSFTPMAEIAVMRHQNIDSRLFAN
jgi:urease accessory protein